MARVISFAGVPLGADHARALAAPLRLPWNMVPANINAEGLRGVAPAVAVDRCLPADRRGQGINNRGYVSAVDPISPVVVVHYTGGSRRQDPRAFVFLGFEKDYSDLRRGGDPTEARTRFYVVVTDTGCAEEVLVDPQAAVILGIVTRADVDRARTNMRKTADQLAVIQQQIVASDRNRKLDNEKAGKDYDCRACIDQWSHIFGSGAVAKFMCCTPNPWSTILRVGLLAVGTAVVVVVGWKVIKAVGR